METHPELTPTQRSAVVVPMHNEAGVVGAVVADLRSQFPLVVCVDDGSRDTCAAEAESSGAFVLRHPINLGQGAALQTGIDFVLQNTDAEFVVTFDSDGQHRVLDAVSMLEPLADDKADVVLGSRFLDERTRLTRTRRLVLFVAVRYTNMRTGRRLTDAHNGLRAMTREAATRIHLTQHGMAHASEIIDQLSEGRLRIMEAPVHILYTDYSRTKGQSSWNSINILFDLIFR